MAEKSDATVRLRRAVGENNLFLVKRLIQRTEMRNPDPNMKRYTSLAWAAVLNHEETFEFLLTAGHDDEELSKDSENNTILMLLADARPAVAGPYSSTPSNNDAMGAVLRMTKMYYDRYSWVLDWSNIQGKTALHIASLKGSEELVRMYCDLGADFDLSDNKGNTPLHYASSWGHIPVVQLLIERGCQFTARNNQGFTASDYAYSFSTRDTLQDTARLQFENNKKSRRQVFAQAAARGHEWGRSQAVDVPPPVPSKNRDRYQVPRMRSGSGTSRTTTTSDSGDNDGSVQPSSQTSLSASSSPSQPSAHSASSGSFFQLPPPSSRSTNLLSAASSSTFAVASPPTSSLLSAPAHSTFSLSVVTRMRERDADAMEKYMRRNRSGSSSTDNKSQNGSNFSSAGPSSNGDDISSLALPGGSGSSTPRRRLRPSFSAAQLRTGHDPSSSQVVISNVVQPPEVRIRAGTTPIPPRSSLAPLHLIRSSSQSNSHRMNGKTTNDSILEKESFTGPPSQYAQFPDPPVTVDQDSSTPTFSVGRRLPFSILSKPLLDASAGHRRGSSTASVRGG